MKFGAEKSDVPSKNRGKLDSKWENGKENRRWNGEKRGRAIGKAPEIRVKTRKDEKKDGLHRAKNERDLSKKTPELGPKTGKSAKNGDFGAKKEGGGGGEKMGFTADFAIL